MTDVFDDLDRLTMASIGDEIVYRPGGGAPLDPAIKGWVTHAETEIATGFGRAVASAITVEINKTDLATPNKATDRIELPRTGRAYKIVDVRQTNSGRLWLLHLAEVVA